MAVKKPTFGAIVAELKKQPREELEPRSDLRPVWKLARLDFGGPWCPKKIKSEVLVEITTKLGHLESQTWPVIGKQSHNVVVGKLSPEAQHRLKELKLDDLGSIYSLRLSATERLWGILVHNTFSALWWDPDHQVCPSFKKHT